MADYKRLVSYIYAYPGGVRDKNVGFAKAEVRNGQFKLTVSVKGVYTDTPELFGVYVMVDGKKHQPGGFTLLKTGTVMVNQGIGQYQDLFNPMNINQSGYTFEDISGIALARENEDFYRMFSLWEDCILNTEDITFAQPEAAAASNPVVQADLILSVGKLKTHCMTGLSGGVKNLFGCIPGLQKPQMHYRFQNTGDFCSMLVDLAQTVAPVLTIIDAVDAMEGNGPSGGTVRHTGCLIASRSPFCLDLFLSRLIALKPQQAPTVLHSIRRGLCPDDPSMLRVLNPDSLPLTIPDFVHPQSKTVDFSGNLPPFLRPAVQKAAKLLSPRPVIDPERCIGCGKCAQSCPAQIILIQEHKAKIHRGCIRCYCCHEMCPVRAIHIRGRV